MGWDAFGLPAENAAIQNNAAAGAMDPAPISTTCASSCSAWASPTTGTARSPPAIPSYYRWEQWFFTRLFEKGLAYKKKAGGELVRRPTRPCWPTSRSSTAAAGAATTRWSGARSTQWFIRITDYAEELLTDLDKLEHWPEQVQHDAAQLDRRAEGIDLSFALAAPLAGISEVPIYTTRPDTLMGVTYLAVALQHPLAKALAEGRPELADFIAECRRSSRWPKPTWPLWKNWAWTPGINAIHPLTGRAVPIWVANFVLMGYGSGAVMSRTGPRPARLGIRAHLRAADRCR